MKWISNVIHFSQNVSTFLSHKRRFLWLTLQWSLHDAVLAVKALSLKLNYGIFGQTASCRNSENVQRLNVVHYFHFFPIMPLGKSRCEIMFYQLRVHGLVFFNWLKVRVSVSDSAGISCCLCLMAADELHGQSILHFLSLLSYFLFSYLFCLVADVSGQVREVELVHADVLEIVFPSAAFVQPQSQNVLAESSVRMSSWTKL